MRTPRKGLDSREPTIESGTRIDQFRILRFVGRGGMGQVYLARDTTLGRKVALKLIRLPKSGVLRFWREAQTTARFNHPNIVTVYAFGNYMGKPYLAMEYLSGQTLRPRINDGSLGPREAVRIIKDIVSAVREAHSHGVLHLDLKPDNVLVTDDGRIKVLDFGLSQPVNAEPTEEEISNPTITSSSGVMAGTPPYMAPEQWQGGRRTEATDIWAVGVMLYELIEGRWPWNESTSVGAMGQEICQEEEVTLSPKSPVAEPLLALIRDCLTKSVSQRPDASQVLQRLASLLDGQDRRALEGESPFRGLLAFTAEQSNLFFGRDREIAEVLERLRTEPVLGVVGASGVGKSSLVSAGVVPRLTEEGRWTVISIRPGAAPHRTLVREVMACHPASGSATMALISEASSKNPRWLSMALEEVAEARRGRVLLVVNQLEELYTMVDSPEEQTAFMQAIALCVDDAKDPVRVLLTLRDDFLSRIAEAGPEVRRMLRRVFLLQVPDEHALAEIMSRPVEAAGYAFEDDTIVQSMVAEVGGKPAGLPLLQFAAQMLWDRRDTKNKRLTQAAYDGMSGVSGALAVHADGVLARFTEPEVVLAKRLLLRMVTANNTRRVVTSAQALEGLPNEAAGVLEQLVEARLVSTTRVPDGEGLSAAFELAHESLMVSWSQLSRWIEESIEERRIVEEIEEAARLWHQRGRRDEEAWTKGALAEAERAVNERALSLSAPARDFLQAGRRRSKRLVITRRAVVSAVFAILLIALGVTSIQRQQAVVQKDRADTQRVQAEKQRAIAHAEGAAAALARQDVFEARAKLRSALGTRDSSASRALWWKMAEEPLVWSIPLARSMRRILVHPQTNRVTVNSIEPWIYEVDLATRTKTLIRTGPLSAMTLSANGRWEARAFKDKTIEIWDGLEKRRLYRFRHDWAPKALRLSHDGRRLYAMNGRGGATIMNAQTGKVLSVLPKDIRVRHLTPFQNDDRFLTTLTDRIQVWALKTDTPTVTWTLPISVEEAAIGLNDSRVITVDKRPDVRIYSLETKELLHRISGPGPLLEVEVSPDGRRLAAESRTRTLMVADIETGQLEATLVGHESSVNAFSFTHDGQYLVSGGSDGALKLWDLTKSVAVPRPAPHSGAIYGLAVHPEGQYLATSSFDKTVRLWDVEHGTVTRVLGEQENPILSVAFHPDGRSVAWGSTTIRMASLTEGEESVVLGGRSRETAMSMAFLPSGQSLIASVGKDLVLYDLATRRELRRWPTHAQAIWSLAIGPEGRRVATAARNGRIGVWDMERGTQLHDFAHRGRAFGVEFDGTGQTLAAAAGGRLFKWRLSDEAQTVIGAHTYLSFDVDLSQDGRLMVSPGADGTVKVWDTESKKTLRTMTGHRGEITQVALGPGERWIASTGVDNTVRLFDRETGRPLWHASGWLHSTSAGWLNGRWVTTDGASVPPNWRRAIEISARWVTDDGQGRFGCLIRFDGHLEVWNLEVDQKMYDASIESTDRLLATEQGCVWKAKDRVVGSPYARYDPKVIASKAQAIAFAEGYILIALEREVKAFDPQGQLQESYPVAAGVTAVSLSRDHLLLGYDTGQLAFMPRTQTATTVTLEPVMASAVTRLMAGPTQTLVAGGQNGEVGLFSLSEGKRLRKDWLHGPVVHLVRDGSHVRAISELGWQTVWNLRRFEVPYCALMKEVWQQVPMAWKDGRAEAALPLVGHRCQTDDDAR